MKAFDPDAFVEACVAALADPSPLQAVEAVMREAVADVRAFDDFLKIPVHPDDGGVLHRSAELMVVGAVFPRGFKTGLHDHRMPAVIGTWAGYEDNLLYRRTPEGLETTGTRRLDPGDVLVLDADAIHDVHAPPTAWTAGLHVYLGDLGAATRSMWSSPDKPEALFDGDEMEARWVEVALATGLAATSASGT